MPIACIYHKTQPMKVVTFEEREKFLATGEWFKHPNCEKLIEVNEHEKPIRQRTRKRRRNAEHETKEIRV